MNSETELPDTVASRLKEGVNPIKVWREHRGLTQQALARAVEITAVYLDQVEQGKLNISVGVLKLIAEELDVELGGLM